MREVHVLLTLLVLLLPISIAIAQTDGFDLPWSTLDGGGYTFSAGGGYELGGTIGQPDAGTMTGGTYSLGGGFWAGGVVVEQYNTYLPLILRNR